MLGQTIVGERCDTNIRAGIQKKGTNERVTRKDHRKIGIAMSTLCIVCNTGILAKTLEMGELAVEMR